jgi:hypothetical protein
LHNSFLMAVSGLLFIRKSAEEGEFGRGLSIELLVASMQITLHFLNPTQRL